MSGQRCTYPSARADTWRERHSRPEFNRSKFTYFIFESNGFLYEYNCLWLKVYSHQLFQPSLALSLRLDDWLVHSSAEQTLDVAVLENIRRLCKEIIVFMVL